MQLMPSGNKKCFIRTREKGVPTPLYLMGAEAGVTKGEEVWRP